MKKRRKIKFEKAPARNPELGDTLFRGGSLPSRFAGPALPGLGERANPAMSSHEFQEQVLPYAPLPPALSLSKILETRAALLGPNARRMDSEMHPKIGFCLKAKSARTGRETHFGAVQILGDVVAYHLFPLYAHPDLLKNVSPELHSRMRGSTCFHFDSLHPGLVAELAELTHSGFERFVADGVL